MKLLKKILPGKKSQQSVVPKKDELVYNFIPQETSDKIYSLFRMSWIFMVMVFCVCLFMGHQLGLAVEMYKNYYLASAATIQSKSLASNISAKESVLQGGTSSVHQYKRVLGDTFKYRAALSRNFSNAGMIEKTAILMKTLRNMPLLEVSVQYSNSSRTYRGALTFDADLVLSSSGETELKNVKEKLAEAGWRLSGRPSQNMENRLVTCMIENRTAFSGPLTEETLPDSLSGNMEEENDEKE